MVLAIKRSEGFTFFFATRRGSIGLQEGQDFANSSTLNECSSINNLSIYHNHYAVFLKKSKGCTTIYHLHSALSRKVPRSFRTESHCKIYINVAGSKPKGTPCVFQHQLTQLKKRLQGYRMKFAGKKTKYRNPEKVVAISRHGASAGKE